VELGGATPPVTISGWVGVIIENIPAGFARYTTDIVAVNSRSDLATFQSVDRSLGLPTDNLLLCGLPLLSGRYRDVPVDTPIKNGDVRRSADCAACPRGPALRIPAAAGVRPCSIPAARSC
jgi:hypothetical protein